MTPSEKFAAATTPTPASAAACRIRGSCASQPVVPTTRFTPCAARRGRFSATASGIEKSMAASTPSTAAAVMPLPPALLSTSRRPATAHPYDALSRSTAFPIRP